MSDELAFGTACAIVLTVIFLGIIGLIWASGHYGNQLAKQCIKQNRDWTFVSGSQDRWECRK